MREYQKKRELQVRVIGSKIEIANIVHRKCVFLLNNIFDARKQQCCVMCDKTSWMELQYGTFQFVYIFIGL